MKNIELAKIVIPKSEIGKLDSRELKRLVMFTFMLNDLNLLQRCLIYVGNTPSETEPEAAAKNVVLSFFLNILLSKIHEMWVFLKENRILSQLGNDDGDLAAKANAVKGFYSERRTKCILEFIRNKFGFHYAYRGDVDETICTAFTKFGCFEAWVSTKDSGNEFFISPIHVFLNLVFDKMRKLSCQGSDDDLMKVLFDLAINGSRIFRDFGVA